MCWGSPIPPHFMSPTFLIVFNTIVVCPFSFGVKRSIPVYSGYSMSSGIDLRGSIPAYSGLFLRISQVNQFEHNCVGHSFSYSALFRPVPPAARTSLIMFNVFVVYSVLFRCEKVYSGSIPQLYSAMPFWPEPCKVPRNCGIDLFSIIPGLFRQISRRDQCEKVYSGSTQSGMEGLFIPAETNCVQRSCSLLCAS